MNPTFDLFFLKWRYWLAGDLPSRRSSAGDYKWVGGMEPLLGAVLRAGSSSRSTARLSGDVCRGGDLSVSMRAFAPERECEGRRWSRGQISARNKACRLEAVQRGGGLGFASQCNQRVSTRLPGKGGRLGCCQEADSRSRSPRPQRGRAAQFTYRPCVHRASCRAVQACYGGGPRWTTSRAHANAPTLTAAVLASLGGGFMSAVAGILGRAG